MSRVNVLQNKRQINNLHITTSELAELCGDPEELVPQKTPFALTALVLHTLCRDIAVLTQCTDDTPEEVLSAIRRRARQAKAALAVIERSVGE